MSEKTKKERQKKATPAQFMTGGKIDLSKALKMYFAGVPQVDIAKVFGVSRQAVSNALKPFKVQNPEAVQAYENNKASMLSEKELMALEALTEEKLKKASARDVATVFGITYDKNRLEQGKSSQNVSCFSHIVELACSGDLELEEFSD